MADMAAIFGEGGLLARHAPGFTPRPDQLRMAEAVAALLSCDREDGAPCTCLTVEAETGLGKTLAYLAPAVCSGKKVMVSTNTRNLQDQILKIRQNLSEVLSIYADNAAALDELTGEEDASPQTEENREMSP